MAVFSWITEQLLRMKWLYDFVTYIVEKVFKLSIQTRQGGSLHFFLYDTIKILILVTVLIFIVTYIQTYFPPERSKKILGRFTGIGGNVMGALLGTVTPFCSCSSIPIFMGFTKVGMPLGITFSFLISSPLVDLAAFLLLLSIFGIYIAVAYVIVGVILAVIAGTIIGNLKTEDQIIPLERDYNKNSDKDLNDDPNEGESSEQAELTKMQRVNMSIEQVKWIVGNVWKYILLGVGIGAIIHNWIPQRIIDVVIGNKNPFAVIIATVVGIPMYADEFGTIPIAEALYLKGVGLGTIMSFMMAVTALSVPSILILSKVIKPKLLWTFVGIVGIGIVIIGYFFNAISFLFI